MTTTTSPLYVQYGCGLSAPEEWINFDISPTLRIQKIPLLGKLLKSQLNVTFPENVRYGDIVKGLPVPAHSCDGLYCSHTLEHLSLEDLRKALANSYTILKKGGIFRCVLPDLEKAARTYLNDLDHGHATSSIRFMQNTLLGITARPRGIKGLLSSFFGNSHHLWMWDHASLAEELKHAGFVNIRKCNYDDCVDNMFKHVEDSGRFTDAVALECRK